MTETRQAIRGPEQIALSAVAAAAVLAFVWMAVRLVTAVVRLATPMPSAVHATDPANGEAYRSLESSLPLFLLDNGSVAFSDSSGYLAIWDGSHSYTAGLYAAAAEVSTALTVIAVVLAVLLLCIRLLRGVPFNRDLTGWVTGAGIALIVGGALTQLVLWLSRQEMLATIAPTVRSNNWRMPSSAIDIDLIPLACGAVLCIIAIAFRIGQRLQRDTVGLV